MKKSLITLIILIASLTATAQTADSLSYLYQQQRNLETDLQAFNTQYNTGTTVMIIGVCASGIGAMIANTDTETGADIPGYYIMYGGLLITATGWIIQLDSHKYLGGKASLTAKGITIDLN